MITSSLFLDYLKLRLPDYSVRRPKGMNLLNNNQVRDMVRKAKSKQCLAVLIDGGIGSNWAIRVVRTLVSVAHRSRMQITKVEAPDPFFWDGKEFTNKTSRMAMIVFSPKPRLKKPTKLVSCAL